MSDEAGRHLALGRRLGPQLGGLPEHTELGAVLVDVVDLAQDGSCSAGSASAMYTRASSSSAWTEMIGTRT